MKQLLIRRAVPWDVIKVTRLLHQGAQEQAESIWYPSPSSDPMKLIRYILGLIDVGLIIVAEAKGDKRIVSALGFQIGRNEWSDDWEMSNEFMYVLPSYRNTDVNSLMMSFAERFADMKVNPQTGKGLPILMSVLSGTSPGVKDKLLERRDYQYGGGNFVRYPKDVQQEERDDTEE